MQNIRETIKFLLNQFVLKVRLIFSTLNLNMQYMAKDMYNQLTFAALGKSNN